MSVETSGFPMSKSKEFHVEWMPYIIGTGIGVLCWIAFAIAKDPIGITTAYGRIAGEFAIPFLGSETVADNTYWKQSPFSFDYGVVFLIALMAGSFASSVLSGTFKFEAVPTVWREEMGRSVSKRFLWAFFGGVIIMFGARLAGGCTSGHGISGSLQLAVSSWIFLAVMLVAGIITSALMFRRHV